MAYVSRNDKKPKLSFIGTGKIFDPELDKYVDVEIVFKTSDIGFEISDSHEHFINIKVDYNKDTKEYWSIKTK